MSVKTVSTILLLVFILSISCDTMKRSLLDIAPLNVNIMRRQNTISSSSKSPIKQLFHVPVRLLNNFRNAVSKDDPKHEEVNGNASNALKRLDQNALIDNKNERGKDTLPYQAQKKYTSTIAPSVSPKHTEKPIDDIWADIINGKVIITTSAVETSSNSTGDETESTTEIDTTTEDVFNRIGNSPQVVASLLG